MNDTVVRLAIILGVAAVVFALVTLVSRKRSRRIRRDGPRQSAIRRTEAVHLPADDPHWLEYSKRLESQSEEKRAKRSERALRRRRSTAAWSAGLVAGGSNDFGSSGGSSCGGGGGCGGGGCGGG